VVVGVAARPLAVAAPVVLPVVLPVPLVDEPVVEPVERPAVEVDDPELAPAAPVVLPPPEAVEPLLAPAVDDGEPVPPPLPLAEEPLFAEPPFAVLLPVVPTAPEPRRFSAVVPVRDVVLVPACAPPVAGTHGTAPGMSCGEPSRGAAVPLCVVGWVVG
jgi:hypothetical protein